MLALEAFNIGLAVEIHDVSLSAKPFGEAILRHIPFISNLHRFLVSTTCRLEHCGLIVSCMQSPSALAATYRSQGRKLTPQRQLLFQLMHGNDRHPTAEALFAEASAQMPGISLRTVYQTLNELAEMGELQFIDIGGGATRFDPNLDDHHHVVCTDCGQIRDVHVKGTAALRPLDLEDFTVSEVGVVFQGVCSSCEKSRAKTGRSAHAKSPALQAKISK